MVDQYQDYEITEEYEITQEYKFTQEYEITQEYENRSDSAKILQPDWLISFLL